MAHFAGVRELDWSENAAVEEFLVEIGRLSADTLERFDETGTRGRVQAEIARAVNIARAFNHAMVSTTNDWTHAVDRIARPTQVIHGVNDPILPLPNGRAIAEHIEGARFRALDHAGHELNPLDLEAICDTITTFISDVDPARPTV